MTMTQQCPAGASRRKLSHGVPGRRLATIFRTIFKGFRTGRREKRTFVDLRELPPYLQRDIGLLDSEEPRDRRGQ